jgi:hypothetical protein
MDLPPLPGGEGVARIGDGQARPVAPFPRDPGPGGAPQGEEVVVARRRGLEAANRKRRSKAEEALVEALKRLQARGEAITAKALAREVSVHHTTASSRTLKAPDRPPGKPP